MATKYYGTGTDRRMHPWTILVAEVEASLSLITAQNYLSKLASMAHLLLTS